MYDTSGGDAERRRGAVTESAGHRPRGDVRHVRTGRQVEKEAGGDKEREVVDSTHADFRGILSAGSGCPGIRSYGCFQPGSGRMRASQSRTAGYSFQSTPISSSKKR